MKNKIGEKDHIQAKKGRGEEEERRRGGGEEERREEEEVEGDMESGRRE